MPDNVTITSGGNSTPPDGTIVATDDVGGVQYQRVKLDVGGDGASSPVVGSVPVSGNVAHDAVDSGNPVKIGGKAVDVVESWPPASVAVGDRVDAAFTTEGAQVVRLDPSGSPVTVTLGASTVPTTNDSVVPQGNTPSTPIATVIAGLAGTVVKIPQLDGSGGLAIQDNGGSLTVDGTIAVSNSFALDATLSTTNTEVGATNETAPATDTASSGLNGRLQRIAQRLTSLIALLPASLGQKTMANGLAVTIASDQSAVPASQSGTWTVQPGNTANTTAWKVDASSVAVPVTDNAGSLTVDAPVGTPVFSRLSDGSAALVGQKAMASSLPVAIASDQSAIGVSDNATREVGRVRLWDGTDEATVLPRDTLATSSDKGLVVYTVIPRRPMYQAVTGEITSATTTGTKENFTIWHPSTLAKDVIVMEIGVNIRVIQTAGTFAWELQFISAENATPGGTTITAQQLNRGDAASGMTLRQVVTGAPTTTGQVFQRASFPLPAAASPFVGSSIDAFQIYGTDDEENGIWLRNGQNEGLRITQNVIAALTTAPVFTIYVRYIERA